MAVARNDEDLVHIGVELLPVVRGDDGGMRIDASLRSFDVHGYMSMKVEVI
jgi:hypothetical protein